MLPDEMEAEKNRKMLVSQADTIEILQTNVRDLQEQLNKAHKRIGELTYQECFCGLADEPVMATEDI
jgi:hypothetical protein